jgi:hypothetical protein
MADLDLPGRKPEIRLDAEIAEQYGSGTTLTPVAPAWRPYRTWAAVHLRALREQRIREIRGPAHSRLWTIAGQDRGPPAT